MEILLVRHGKPAIDQFPRLSAQDMRHWIDAYNQAGVRSDPPPSPALTAAVKNSRTLVTSGLKRAVESARTLGFYHPQISDPLFREADLPHGDGRSLKLPPNLWAAVFRLSWFAGYSRNAESMTDCRRRMEIAAQRLVEVAHDGSPVLLVGHAIANRFIAGHLLATGWQGPKSPGSGYWGFGLYRKD